MKITVYLSAYSILSLQRGDIVYPYFHSGEKLIQVELDENKYSFQSDSTGRFLVLLK